MKKLLRYFFIPASQIIAILCAFVIGFAQIPTLYLLLTQQVSEGQSIFMDEVATNLNDLIFRTIINFGLFILCAFIAYRGRKFITQNSHN